MRKTRLICWLPFIVIAGCSSGPPVKEVDPFSGLGAVKQGAAATDLRKLARERIAVVPSGNTRNLIRFYADAKDGLAINPDTVLGKTLYADWDQDVLVDGPTRVIKRFLGAPIAATDLKDAKGKGATVAAVIDVFSNLKVTNQEVLEGGRYDNTWRFSVIFVRLDSNSTIATVDGYDTENCPFGATAESLAAARCHVKARELALAHMETALQERLAAARAMQWKKVDVASALHMNGTYIDADAIEHAGDLATMWHMFDFSVPQAVATDPKASYLSAKVQQEYNCAEKRARVLSAATYAENLARNTPLAETSQPGPWNAVPPNSTVAKLMQYACGEIK